jgi:hypothetical protein
MSGAAMMRFISTRSPGQAAIVPDRIASMSAVAPFSRSTASTIGVHAAATLGQHGLWPSLVSLCSRSATRAPDLCQSFVRNWETPNTSRWNAAPSAYRGNICSSELLLHWQMAARARTMRMNKPGNASSVANVKR